MQFLRMASGLFYLFAGVCLVLGLLNVIFGWKIGLRGQALPDDLPGVLLITDALLVLGVLLHIASGPRAFIAWVKDNRLRFGAAFVVLFAAPGVYAGIMLSGPENIFVEIQKGRNPKHLDELIAKGVSVNQLDERGTHTLLMHAVTDSPAEVVEKLLAAGADVNAVGASGMTALMHCLTYRRLGAEDHLRVVRALLAKGARTNVVDSNGRAMVDRAKDAAKDLNAPELLALIR